MLLYLSLSSSILPNQNDARLTLPCGETRCPELDWSHQFRLGPGDLLLDGRAGPTFQKVRRRSGMRRTDARRPVSNGCSMPGSRIARRSITFRIAVGD